MKQNTKFIWIYVAILFSFALILILFAGLTQNNYQKEIEQHENQSAGIQKSLSSLASENSTMKKTIKELEAENAQLKTDNQTLLAEKEAAVVAYGGDVAVTRKLLTAYNEKIAGHGEAALELVKELREENMTEAQKFLYQTIIGE